MTPGREHITLDLIIRIRDRMVRVADDMWPPRKWYEIGMPPRMPSAQELIHKNKIEVLSLAIAMRMRGLSLSDEALNIIQEMQR